MPVPVDFEARPLAIREFAASSFVRIHQTSRSPLYFGNHAVYRLDDPKKEFGVLYAAETLTVAFAETLIRERAATSLVNGAIPVPMRDVSIRSVSTFDADKPLRLANLTGIALLHLGGDASELQSANYQDHSQPWSAAVYHRPEEVDGILYQSRYVSDRCAVAIFDRGAIRVGLRVQDTIDLRLFPTLAATLDELRVGLI